MQGVTAKTKPPDPQPGKGPVPVALVSIMFSEQGAMEGSRVREEMKLKTQGLQKVGKVFSDISYKLAKADPLLC